MSSTVTVYCIKIHEQVSNQWGWEESRTGFFAIDNDNFSICEDPTDETVIKTFSKQKIQHWVEKCKEFVSQSNVINQNDTHIVQFNVKKLHLPFKHLQKQLRKEKYI